MASLTLLSGAVVMVALYLAACNGAGGPSPTVPGPTPSPVTGLIRLVDDLRAAGLPAQVGGKVEKFFFSVKGTVLLADDGTLEVFEYEEERVATAEAARISPDGTKVEVPSNGGRVATSLFWVATPHFYKRGKLVVLYVGDDAKVTGALKRVLGSQFAGG